MLIRQKELSVHLQIADVENPNNGTTGNGLHCPDKYCQPQHSIDDGWHPGKVVDIRLDDPIDSIIVSIFFQINGCTDTQWEMQLIRREKDSP